MPFTRAGCDVGDVSTVNQELENTSVDIPKVFGANSPEAQQLAADPDSFKDPETADYVGLAVHCAKGNAFCANAKAVKYGQTTPSHTAVPDLLPDEPGGYTGYQGLFGHRYIAPQLGAGTPNLTEQRLSGDQRRREPGRPEREPDQRRLPDQPPRVPRLQQHQRLADPGLHGRHAGERASRWSTGTSRTSTGTRTSPACPRAPARRTALGSGSACYVAQAQYYNQAFGTFFKRLAADGITAEEHAVRPQLGRG